MIDASTQTITVKKSMILFRGARLGLLAFRKIGKREVVGYYYGSLTYTNLTKEWLSTKAYGKGLMRVFAETFER